MPLKWLIWEDKQGDVWLMYNAPNYIQARHEVKGCDEVLLKITTALAGLTMAAAGGK